MKPKSLWLAVAKTALASAIVAIPAAALAQTDVLYELYGQGYHAFYRHDLTTAEQLFTSAIAEGSKDPRVYYYRGLTYACQGRMYEAEADFRDGAMHEAEGHGRRIGQALSRVQGTMRLKIEKARFAARLDVARRRAFEQPEVTPRRLPDVPTGPRRDPFVEPAPDTEPAPVEVPQPEPVDEEPMPEPFDAPEVDVPSEQPATPPADAPLGDDPFATDGADFGF